MKQKQNLQSATLSSWSKVFGKRKLPDGNIPDTVKKLHSNGVSDWVGRPKDIAEPIFYTSSIAGSKGWSESRFIKLTGINHRCYSFAYTSPTSPMHHLKHYKYLDIALNRGMGVFMDSGAHTLHKILRSGKTLAKRFNVDKDQRHNFIEFLSEEFLRRYAEYIRWCYSTKRRFDFYVTLDSQKNCAVIYNMTKRLHKMIGVPPVPVYHGDSTLDWVRRYIDEGHKLLGVGIDSKNKKDRNARHRYYSELHELTQKYGMSTHGFAVTGDNMLRYPWHSVDSATHIKVAAFGKIIMMMPEKNRMAQVHISDNYSEFTGYGNMCSLSKGVEKYIRDTVENKGFDLDELKKDGNLRVMWNAKVLQEAINANAKNRLEFKTWSPLI